MDDAAVVERAPPRSIRAALPLPAPMRGWPRPLRPGAVLITRDGLELVYRAPRLGEAIFLLADATRGGRPACGVRCLVRGAAAEPTDALESALRDRVNRLGADSAQTLRHLAALVRAVERGPAENDPAWIAALHDTLSRADVGDDEERDADALPPSVIGALLTARLAAGDVAHALALADRLDTTSRTSVGAIAALALIGRGPAGVARLDAATDRPASPGVRRAQALLGVTLQAWPLAFVAWRAAVDPGRADDLGPCARVALEVGEREWAAAAGRRLWDIATSLEERLEAAQILVAAEAAGELLDRAAALHASGGGAAALWMFVAEVSLWLDRHDDCEEWLGRVDDPAIAWRAGRARGGLAVRRGRLEEAVGILEGVLDARPRDLETTLWLGEAHVRAGHESLAAGVLARFEHKVTGEHPIGKMLDALASLRASRRQRETLGPLGSTLYVHRNIVADVLGASRDLGALDEATERAHVLEAIDAFGGNRSEAPTLLDRERRELRSARHVVDPRVRVVEDQHRVRFEDPDAVRAVLRRHVETRPDVPYGRTYLAELDLWQGRYEDAADAFQRIWEETGTRWGYVGWGASLIALGAYEEGIAVLDAGVTRLSGAIDGEATPAYRGEALRALGRLGEAREELERATRLRPNRLGAWASLALLRHEMGREGEAVEAASRFVRAAPVLVWEAHRSLGLTPGLEPPGDDRWRVVERCLALMAGNRSSYLLTFFDAAGDWRVMTTHGHIEQMTELARRIEVESCVSALEEMLASDPAASWVS